MILLIAVTLLILAGVLQRVLDRMALTDRQAIACLAAIFIGGWLPDLTLGMITVNIGGALIPLVVCIYLFFHTGTGKEKLRCLIATALTAASIYAISAFFPADPTAMPFDPMILYGVAGGVIAWLLGRSRRSAFVAGVIGVIIADVITAINTWRSGVNQPLHLGSAGAFDAVVLSGITSVLFCELLGELIERITTGRAKAPHEDGAIQGGHRA